MEPLDPIPPVIPSLPPVTRPARSERVRRDGGQSGWTGDGRRRAPAPETPPDAEEAIAEPAPETEGEDPDDGRPHIDISV